jgi:hypothetical protein
MPNGSIRVSCGLVFRKAVWNEVSLDRWSRHIITDYHSRERCLYGRVENYAVFSNAFRVFVNVFVTL